METNQENPNKKKKPLNDYARYSGIAVKMLSIILAGVLSGIKIDAWLKLKIPVFTLVLTLTAVGFSMYIIIKDANS
jgi:F0F1-type ATP synthase assembly protein I